MPELQPWPTRRLAATCVAAALAVGLAAPASPALAQAGYPDKPIHITVTFTSGGAPDILARLLGERL